MITDFEKYLSLFVVLLLTGCIGSNNNDNTVAKVGDKILYMTEITEVLPTGLTRADSILMAQDYIKKWVKQELLISKAEENLIPVMRDVTQELINYRNSLIIYRYKNELMRQKMDTIVNRTEIEQFFNENRENFKLNRNIFKGVYIKIIKGLFEPNIIRALCENTTPLGLTEFKDFCFQYAKSYGIYLDKWAEFDVLLNNIPLEIMDQENYLSRNDRIEFTDADYYYFALIKDYRLVNEIAPIEYMSENIRSLILNKRKIEFLNKIDEDIYNEGLRNRKFIIYKN